MLASLCLCDYNPPSPGTQMMILAFTVFTIAGILLWINEHKGWSVLCFLIALVILLAMVAI
jgi:hypothetical protein